MKMNPLVIGGIVLAVLLAGMLSRNFEQVERVINEGPASAVRINNFYAAGKFLDALGMNVSHSSDQVFTDDLDHNDVLIITDTRALESSKRARDLVKWVKQGGHLIWEYTDEEKPTPLAEMLDISSEKTDSERHKDTRSPIVEALIEIVESNNAESAKELHLDNSDPESASNQTPSSQVRPDIREEESKLTSDLVGKLYNDQGSMDVKIYNSSPISLSHPQLYDDINDPEMRLLFWSDTGDITDLLHFQLGNGFVSVINDSEMWDNQHIGLFDNAHMLRILAQNADRVVIQRYVNWPSIGFLIYNYTLEVLISVLLTAFLWALYKGRRFGPIRPVASMTRRSIAEHIGATATYHYRNSQHDFLIAPLRREIKRKMQRNYSSFDQMELQTQIALIADNSGHNKSDVNLALNESGQYTDTDLLNIIQLLIKIRDSL